MARGVLVDQGLPVTGPPAEAPGRRPARLGLARAGSPRETVLDAGEVYRELAPAVLGYLRARGAPDPENVLGEVFLGVARDLSGFRGDATARRRWVFTIAHNRLTDAHRRRARRPEVVDAEPIGGEAPPPEDPVDPELVAALAALSDGQREVVVLRFVADLSLDDVAAITGRTTNAVKAMQHRALAGLRRRLTGSPESA